MFTATLNRAGGSPRGVDGDDGWDTAENLAGSTRAMLTEAGRTYAPFMIANAAAVPDVVPESLADTAMFSMS